MTMGMNIRKITSPTIRTSRIHKTKRQNRDLPRKHPKEHFDDEKNDGSDEGLANDRKQPPRQGETEKAKAGFDTEKTPASLNKDLGEKIDIHV